MPSTTCELPGVDDDCVVGAERFAFYEPACATLAFVGSVLVAAHVHGVLHNIWTGKSSRANIGLGVCAALGSLGVVMKMTNAYQIRHAARFPGALGAGMANCSSLSIGLYYTYQLQTRLRHLQRRAKPTWSVRVGRGDELRP